MPLIQTAQHRLHQDTAVLNIKGSANAVIKVENSSMLLPHCQFTDQLQMHTPTFEFCNLYLTWSSLYLFCLPGWLRALYLYLGFGGTHYTGLAELVDL